MKRSRKYGVNLKVEQGREVIVSRIDAYFFARRLKKFRRKDVNNWTGYCKIVNTFHRIIAENLTNNPEGVFIENLGYFGLLLYRRRGGLVNYLFMEDYGECFINPKTDGAVFTINFTPIPNKYAPQLRTFTMDGTFSKPLKKKIVEKLKEGFKYRNNLEMFLKSREND